MNGPPEQRIRRYLDEHGGRVEVPAYHLLTSWEFELFTIPNRRAIESDLAHAGVAIDPPLDTVDENTPVVLYVREREPGSAVAGRSRRRPSLGRVLVVLLALLIVVGVPGALLLANTSNRDKAPGTAEQPEPTETSTAEARREQELERERARAERKAKARRARARARKARARRARARRARARRAPIHRRRRRAQEARRRERQQQAPACHPSYSPCLDPNASDYDCKGRSGDGPAYTGPVTVKGSDPFDLDRNHDGRGCE